jgi:AbrB family looped-hinge helix DNA binding protein
MSFPLDDETKTHALSIGKTVLLSMGSRVQEIAFTRASSKGQIVIPTRMRERFGIRTGSMFSISARKDMIVLKKIQPALSQQDLRSLRMIEEAWKDVEQGRYRVASRKSFFKELKEW